MNKNDITAIIEEDDISDKIEENILPPENIVVLNELRSAYDLYRLMSDVESININPDFQRDEVWSPQARARFIDSMSKEFPIPSMCFALDPVEQKYIVIDGLQRMSTIKQFLDDPDYVLPNLNDIDERLSGNSVAKIKKDNPNLFRRIENLSLPVTILRYDPRRPDNMEYIFTIFQRINTFGERLNNQEIRNAVFQGTFNTFLKEYTEKANWIQSNFGKNKRSDRMKSEEKLLRFFAFYDDSESYKGKYNVFLNAYMQKNRHASDLDSKIELINNVSSVINKINKKDLIKSNAYMDAVLFGIAKNINFTKTLSKNELHSLLETLKLDENFTIESLSGGTMQKIKVQKRLKVAEMIFAEK